MATGAAVQSFGHTVLGCWALRAGLLTAERHVPAIRKLFAVTGIATIALWAWTLSLSPADENLARAGGNLAVVAAVAYLTGRMLLLRSALLRADLLPLQRYGRMALTSYLPHAILGLAVVGALRCGRSRRRCSCCCTCRSGWWLSRFTYGPFEWLWRAGIDRLDPLPGGRHGFRSGVHGKSPRVRCGGGESTAVLSGRA
ncbi:DUF418 domain-containing protein [Amycolatopsis sp. FDAARGOS 1241]|uniref:DUF418 domain-containing protein n=1 Tax=Amycolatopsis sp. FDAARGOS 1241 TaxID=2778070 RepID=UPI00194FA924|nr:DUF418 domain-containing protein [Amycolatopsis sp. FDAARGOS 1241]QRP47090.1 DUF418 domain-containing protein [Amycolatopsis sp. FDAARGOS 1241]